MSVLNFRMATKVRQNVGANSSVVKCATTRVCDAIHSLAFAATSTPPMLISSCQLVTPQSTLRPNSLNRTVLQQRALVVSDTHVQLSRAYEAHERAVSWETSSCAWLANVCSIEIYLSLRPLPESFSEPVCGICRAQLNELLEMCAEKKMHS